MARAKTARHAPKPVPIDTQTQETPPPPPPAAPAIEREPKLSAEDKKTLAKLNTAAFWDKVTDIPKPEEWGEEGRYYIYLYQLQPYNNLKVDGMPGYLMKYHHPIDAQVIMDTFGSGQYHLKFKKKRNNSTSRGDNLIADHTFEIFNPAYPPKLNPEIWRKDSRNDRWLKLLPKETPQQQQNGNGNGNITVKEVFEIVGDIQDREAARYEERAPAAAPDPVAQLAGVTGILKDLRGEDSKGESGVLGMMRFFIEQQGKQIDALRTEIKESRQPAAAPAQDPLTQKIMEHMVTEFLEGKTKEPEERSDQRSRLNGTQEFIRDITHEFLSSPAVANLTQGFNYFMMAKTGSARPAAQQQPFYQQPAPGQPLPAPAGQPQPQAPGAGPTVGVPVGMKLTAQQLSGFVGEFITPFMNHIQDKDKDGWDLAEWLIMQRGKMAYDFIANHGPDTLMEAFKLSQFWSDLAPFEPQVRTYIEQFCSWPPPEDLNIKDGDPGPDDDEEQQDAAGRIPLE